MRRCFLLLIAGAGVLSGCEDDKSAAVRGGQLGAADFTYVCGPDTDPQCNADSDVAQPGEFSTFPRIAAGGSFGMSVKPRSGSEQDVFLDFARPFFDFDSQARLFKGKKAGVASILGVRSGVIDLTWIEIVKPDHIKLVQATPDGKFKDGSVSIGPGGVSAQASLQFTYKFRAIAADKDDKLLAGSFPCAWTTSDPAVANLTSPPTANIATVVSGNAGTATVHVTLGDLAADITIKVN